MAPLSPVVTWPAATGRPAAPSVTGPVAVLVLGLAIGAFTVAGIDVVGGQPGSLVVVVLAGVVAVRRRAVTVDRSALLLLVPAVVAVAQRATLGADAGGVGVFVPLALVALVLPGFGPPRRLPAWPYAVLGVGLAAWMATGVVPRLFEDDLRFYTLKGSANLPIGPGNLVAIVLVVPILLLLETPRSRWRTGALVALVAGLAMTLSRAAWLILGVTLLARWWVDGRTTGDPPGQRRRVVRWAGVAAAVLALVALVMLATGGTDRLADVARPAVGVRLEIWETGVRGVVDHPVRGYGLYGFEDLLAATGRPENHPSNLVLAALGMFGVVGGTAYLAWWALALRRALRSRTARRAGWALLAVFLHAQLDAWTFHLPFELLAVSLLAVAVLAPDTGQVSSSRRNLPV